MDLAIHILWIPTLALTACRAIGLLLVAPVFSHPSVPIRVRVFLGIVVAVAAVHWMTIPLVAMSVPGMLVAGVTELAIGAAIGYAARLMFVGVEMAAGYAGQQMGLSLGELYDASAEDEGGGVRQLYRLLAIIVFLAIGGHREMIGAMLRSFDAVPLAGMISPQAALDTMTGLLAVSFVLAIKIACPVIVTLLLVTVAMGLLGRTMPQANILSVGLPVQAMIGMVVLAGAVAVLPGLLESAWKLTALRLAELM